MARKIIIDTDPGIDDAMAIFYALESPELDVVGITTVFGNADVSLCTTNALRLMEIANRRDIPVCMGAARPLMSPFRGGADVVHGADSQGDQFLPLPTLQQHHLNAVDFLAQTIKDNPGEITLVPIAPLTNIALLLSLHPGIDKLIREIVLMGGNAYVPGNITPAAEANVWNDAEAADIVFGADCPITMIGLDVTEKLRMTADQLDGMSRIDNARAQHLTRIIPTYRRFHQKYYDADVIFVHDSTTITYLLNPGIFRTIQRPIRVELTGLGRGKTWLAFGRSDQETEWQNRQAVTVAVEVEVKEAIRMELERLAWT